MSYYFMGQGRIFVAKRAPNGQPGGYRLLGNCSRYDLILGAGAMRFIDRGGEKSPLMPSGGMPGFTLDLESLDKQNLALLLHGDTVTLAPGNTVETITARIGYLVPLPHINLTNFVALRAPGGAAYPASSYKVNMATGSIEFPANSAVPDGGSVVAEYAYGSQSTTGAYTTKQDYHTVRFEGINTMDGNAPVTVDMFKVKFDPVDDISLLGDNQSVLKVNGKLFYDDLIPASTPEGRLLRIRQT